MIPIVMDSETTIRNQGDGAIGNFSGSPFHPDNFIVSVGEYHFEDGYSELYSENGVTDLPRYLRIALSGQDVMVIGHNLAFDLCYAMKTWPDDMDKALPHIYIWDTQQVEFLLSGQTEMYPSLDQCCVKRGLPLKDDKIKAYWNEGVDTPMIPKDELLDYQEQDVMNTLYVYLDQREQLLGKDGLYELVKTKMDDLLATTMMTWNGMKFDLQAAHERVTELDKGKEALYNRIMAIGQGMFPEGFEFNPLSPEHISLVLFGGHCKRKEDVVQFDPVTGLVMRYKGGQKGGQIRTKKMDVFYPVKGLGLYPATYGIPAMKKEGVWSTDSEYLAKIDTDFTRDVLAFRELEKDSETYYRGYAALVWPDGCIHPNINHESARTGRQSCTNPNLQNVTRDDD